MNHIRQTRTMPTPSTAPIDIFHYWITERESIRLAREAGLITWTNDPILRDFRFCNVRREDDKVTRWIAENIRKPYAGNPNLWFMLCIARIINLPESLQELMDNGAWPVDEWNPDLAASVLEARKTRGDQVETGAYMIRAESNRDVIWYSWTKQRYICSIVLGQLWNGRIGIESMFSDNSATLESVHRWMKTNYGWGDFMSYQAVVDMRFTGLLENAPDVESWAAAGPGTIRGLNRLHGRDVKYRLKQDQALDEIRALYKEAKVWMPSIDFSDVPNILCECDKYMRVLNGEGKPRAKYRAAA